MAGLIRLRKEHLVLLGIAADSISAEDLIFKKVSDDGSNIKSAWEEDGKWVSCANHRLELVTHPFTWTKKNKGGDDAKIPAGSVQDSFRKGRGIVGYLHVATKALEGKKLRRPGFSGG